LVAAYNRLLEWEIMNQPRLVRGLERALNPVLGKSLVIHAHRPIEAGRAA